MNRKWQQKKQTNKITKEKHKNMLREEDIFNLLFEARDSFRPNVFKNLCSLIELK